MRQRQGQELESKEGKFDVEHCSKSRNLIFTKFPVLHVTVFAVTRLSRGEEGNFKSSPMVTLIYKIYLMYIEEKRTSLKISSLMGDFKDLCKKKNQTCCWYFACQGTSMSKLENTNCCIHQLTDGRLSFSATGASSRKIRFHNIFATAVLSSFICEKMHILTNHYLKGRVLFGGSNALCLREAFRAVDFISSSPLCTDTAPRGFQVAAVRCPLLTR